MAVHTCHNTIKNINLIDLAWIYMPNWMKVNLFHYLCANKTSNYGRSKSYKLVLVEKKRTNKWLSDQMGVTPRRYLSGAQTHHSLTCQAFWRDNILRAFYITESALQGWSRDLMLMQIDDGYHKKVKSLSNNFADTLPPIITRKSRASILWIVLNIFIQQMRHLKCRRIGQPRISLMVVLAS